MMYRLLVVAVALVASSLWFVSVGAVQPAAGAAYSHVAEGRYDVVPLPELRVDYAEASGARLSGRVPDEREHAALLQRARTIYGAERVQDALVAGGVANPSWLSPAFLPDLRATTQASARLADGELDIDGVVSSDAARQRVASAVAGFAAYGVRVHNRLSVSAD